MASSIVTEPGEVVVGVDTHADIHVAVVLSSLGARLGSTQVATTAAGFRELVVWASGFGPIACFAVEGTGSYGATLARHLRDGGHTVVEVDRPDRRTRRLRGKSDPVDAEAAARAVLAGEASGCPKAGDGRVEMIRSLRVVRRSALKARTQATNQLLALVLTSPEELRASLRALSVPRLVRVAARLRPGPLVGPAAAAKLALRHLAQRHAALSAEIVKLDRDLALVVANAAPALLALPGVGTDVAGALLVAAGDNPERLSSGSGVRQALRGSAASCLLGQDQPAPVEPRRGPDRQQRAVADRPCPDEFGPQDEELRGAADQGGAVQEGDHPLPKTLRGAGDLSPSRSPL